MKKLFIIIPFLFFLIACTEREKVVFTVTPGDYAYLDCPVNLDLQYLFSEIPEYMVLYEDTPDGQVQLPFQYDMNHPGTVIWFTVTGELNVGETRTYYLEKTTKKRGSSPHTVNITQTEDEVMVTESDRPILNYRKSEMMPPEGVDEIYRRSGYIHPIWSPGGEILTRIQPPDHYHHYGIWNPWTKTHIQGREIDYWNLAKGEGTVRSKALLTMSEGPVYGSFTVLQEHVDFGHEGGERVTMDEFWEITYRGSLVSGDRYILDLNTTLRNVLQDTILFDAYRYGGGLGFRATEKWKAESCTVLTSEGDDRSTADGSRARWCIVEGESSAGQGRSGILFMSHPRNREHPEPMRVWPDNVHQGEMFFEFCPIRHNDWIIEPGVDKYLAYRLVVFDGTMSADEAQRHWNGFAHPPVAGKETTGVLPVHH
ncbi:MAG: PmoA family protein [Bacteroidales bacterium]